MSGWPELSIEHDHETLAMLHLAAQMLGKIRVAHAPWVNHGWHVALQPNARGFSTLPTDAGDNRSFTLTLDLCRHAIVGQRRFARGGAAQCREHRRAAPPADRDA